ncbi:DUF4249 domain-containing protein [Solitalea lacus]|uniref:DUF4249 domain-containing protein n=1 Tax=Solitalea lacus TaxID=2911172 RepID=UPI001EDA86B4|nr:DUF4249 domain-containing protein [Solitalea lacus]UKJ06750.1 DUF4249 domain-containing protein [Solitalea lacus]
MKYLKLFYILSICMLSLSSCEDVIDVKLDDGPALLSVDGWITNRPIPDTIKLSHTAPYFSNSPAPAVVGAKLVLSAASGAVELLTEVSPGKYLVKNIRSIEGEKYTLRIEYDNEVYEAKTQTARQGFNIDSLAFEYKEKSLYRDEDGYIVKFYGQETKGLGDACRIKLRKNGNYLSKVADLNFMNDQYVDGNKLQDLELFSEKPFQLKDLVTVETWSITMDDYHFYDELHIQVMNGGIFANPPANVRTNVQNVNPQSPKKAVGYFGASLVRSISSIVREK